MASNRGRPQTLILPAPPREPVDIVEVLALYPTLRQSLLSKFDDCHLSTLFELRYAKGWNTHPQSRGSMFHRFAAEMIRTMRRQGAVEIPVSEALEILYEVLRQRDVPVSERIRVPLREIAMLRMAVVKFAHENRFTISRILGVEEQLRAKVYYDSPDGRVERFLTGTLDVLMADKDDEAGAVVIDWKDTWALPPEDIEDEDDGHPDKGEHVSYEGYFQQRFYALLVFANFPAVDRVTLREFYPRKTKVREATVHRATDLEHIEREMSILAEEFDVTVAAGTEHAGTLNELDAWRPSPGKHCAFCARKSACPIEDRARGVGMIRTGEMAKLIAGELEVATEIRKGHWEALKAWCTLNGPVVLKSAKGKRWAGFKERVEHHRRKGDGKVVPRTKSRFGIWNGSPPEFTVEDVDRELQQAMRESVAETRRLREQTPA